MCIRDSCGYYLNELLMHLLPREDAHKKLFERYSEMVSRLAEDAGAGEREADLRCFEKALLQELGYGLTLNHDSSGKEIIPAAHYTYRMEQGPVRLEHAGAATQVVSGKTLLDPVSYTHLDVYKRQVSRRRPWPTVTRRLNSTSRSYRC